jgi:hypothetical protein
MRRVSRLCPSVSIRSRTRLTRFFASCPGPLSSKLAVYNTLLCIEYVLAGPLYAPTCDAIAFNSHLTLLFVAAADQTSESERAMLRLVCKKNPCRGCRAVNSGTPD